MPAVQITGRINRRGDLLSLGYDLIGQAAAITIPSHGGRPLRRYGLWNETCFELFLGIESSDRYWEFNFSPKGHWNVFRFETYRKDMREESTFVSLPFSVHALPESLNLSVEIHLAKIIPADQALKAGISAVLRSVEGDCTYWALTHPSAQPDFHSREGFIISC